MKPNKNAYKKIIEISILVYKIICRIAFYTFENKTIISKSKVGDLTRGWPKGSLFNSYYT